MLARLKTPTNFYSLKQIFRCSVCLSRNVSTTRINSDFYQTLGVNKDATSEDIDKAYFEKLKSMPVHMGLNVQENTKLLEAYETLIDNDRRREYDNKHINCVKLDNLEELVKSASEAGHFKSEHRNNPILVAEGLNANNSKNVRELNPDQMRFIGKVLGITFLIITGPKLAYLAYKYLKGDTFV